MNHLKYEKHNYDKNRNSNDYTKNNNTRRDLIKNSYSNHDSRQYYNKEDSNYKSNQKITTEKHRSNNSYCSKPYITDQERSHSYDFYDKQYHEESLIKARKNHEDNINNSEIRTIKSSIKFEEDESNNYFNKFLAKIIYFRSTK